MNNIIVGMGEALWDVLPEGKKIGGAPANFAYHVSQFGFDSRVVSAVGNDELGDEIMEGFKERHHIDPEIYEFFIQSGIPSQYAADYLRPEQCDV